MQTEKRLTDYFDEIRIVNLKSRHDRRQALTRQLAKIGLTAGKDGVEFFDALRPATAEGFPNIGTRGCFNSHLQVLKSAEASASEHLLVLEDDSNFIDSFSVHWTRLHNILAHEQWDICYLGHDLGARNRKIPDFSYYFGPISTAHAYAINLRVLPALIVYLESVLERPPGHPLGGPMHYDGALSMFRAQNPQIRTLVLSPPLVYQRSSRTDIHALAFYDRLSVLRPIANWARNCKSQLVPK